MLKIHLKFTEKLVSCLLLACIVIARPLLSEAASYTWGQLSKYASPIYDEEILLTDANRTVDITFPEKGCIDCSDYTITAMHAFDMQTPPFRMAADGERLSDANAKSMDLPAADLASAEILRGGIGFNYTTLRFRISTRPYQLPAGGGGGEQTVDHEGGDDAGPGNAVRAHYQLVIYGVSI
ncbi:uncharacterized protein LOC128868501 [Anastrepha ludens]|uniref:uncharacterized protein LOC128868501 n=1 Tax=Anastrepha ludens TaxID=28586 RepID=UPI0023B0F9BF|nr:uncharacterized protein LOC128868501 [Anastrepha ludens]